MTTAQYYAIKKELEEIKTSLKKDESCKIENSDKYVLKSIIDSLLSHCKSSAYIEYKDGKWYDVTTSCEKERQFKFTMEYYEHLEQRVNEILFKEEV